MSNTPSLTPKELIKILKQKGFRLNRIKGSHHYFVNASNGKIAVVPFHNKDIPKGTFHSILKQAGIEASEL